MQRRPVRRKRRNRRGLRTFLILASVGAAAYIIWLLSQTLFLPTAVIADDVITSEYVADAVIIRDERLIDAESASQITFFAEEGATVEIGTQIAQAYSVGYSRSDLDKLRTIQEDIKLHFETLMMDGIGDTQLTRIQGTIDSITEQIRGVAKNPNAGSALALKRQLERALTDKSNYLRQKYATDNTLNNFVSTEKTQKKRIESWTSSFIADKRGIISFYTDGYERVLTPAYLETMTAGDARNVLVRVAPEITAAERARAVIGKLVEMNGFYVAVLSQDANWQPVEGSSVGVVIQGLDDITYQATVMKSSRTGGDLLVRMYVEADVRQVLNMRQVKVRVVPQSVAGLKVPVSALMTYEGRIGVVLNVGSGVFVPVKVVTRDSKNAIIEPEEFGMLAAGQKIRTY